MRYNPRSLANAQDDLLLLVFLRLVCLYVYVTLCAGRSKKGLVVAIGSLILQTNLLHIFSLRLDPLRDEVSAGQWFIRSTSASRGQRDLTVCEIDIG